MSKKDEVKPFYYLYVLGTDKPKATENHDFYIKSGTYSDLLDKTLNSITDKANTDFVNRMNQKGIDKVNKIAQDKFCKEMAKRLFNKMYRDGI